MRVTVYTKPGCVQCKYTFKQLEKDGIEYTAVDVTLPENEAEYDRIKASGNITMPQVKVEYDDGSVDDDWVGFSPDSIKALKLRLDAAA